MLSIHLPSYISVHALSYLVIIINQSIHINLSAGAQNITGANVINYACLQVLVDNTFTSVEAGFICVT